MNRTRRRIVLEMAALCSLLILPDSRAVLSCNDQSLMDRKSLQAVEDEKEKIREVISRSQAEETCKIYVHPTTFDRSLLTKYWVPANKGGRAILEVESAIGRLRHHHWHYSENCNNEKFDVREITIQPPGDVADVRTSERWYVPMMDENGNVVWDRPAFLEYDTDYRLVKIAGKWLILSGGRYRKD